MTTNQLVLTALDTIKGVVNIVSVLAEIEEQGEDLILFCFNLHPNFTLEVGSETLKTTIKVVCT